MRLPRGGRAGRGRCATGDSDRRRHRRYRRPAPDPACVRTDPRSRDGAHRPWPNLPPGRQQSRRPSEIPMTSGYLVEGRGVPRPDAVDRWNVVDEFDDGGRFPADIATVDYGIELVIEQLFDLPALSEGLGLVGKEQRR